MSVNFYTGANNITVKNTLTDELKTSYDEAVELVNKLGSDATVEGSVAQRLAAIVANAPEKYDTLKEIATWIESDTDGAAKMQADIATLEADKLDKTSVSSWAKASAKPNYTASEISMTDGTNVENAIGTINSNMSGFFQKRISSSVVGSTGTYTTKLSNGCYMIITDQGGALAFQGAYLVWVAVYDTGCKVVELVKNDYLTVTIATDGTLTIKNSWAAAAYYLTINRLASN